MTVTGKTNSVLFLMQNKKVGFMKKPEVPIWEKSLLTVQEASAYFNIGERKIRELTADDRCECVLYVGTKRLIKRKRFKGTWKNNTPSEVAERAVAKARLVDTQCRIEYNLTDQAFSSVGRGFPVSTKRKGGITALQRKKLTTKGCSFMQTYTNLYQDTTSTKLKHQ